MFQRRVCDDLRFAHFLTFSCDRRRRLLDHDVPRRIVLGVLGDHLERQAGRCVGFVVMPEHVHAIVWLPEAGQLSRFVREWKRRSSLNIRSNHRDQGLSYFQDVEAGSRFWQPRYYEFAIYGRSKLEEKLAYMHLNPVRAGLVHRCEDWPWSSARWYESGRSVGVPLSWVPGLEGPDR